MKGLSKELNKVDLIGNIKELLRNNKFYIIVV